MLAGLGSFGAYHLVIIHPFVGTVGVIEGFQRTQFNDLGGTRLIAYVYIINLVMLHVKLLRQVALVRPLIP